jgi:hypothetical protein
MAVKNHALTAAFVMCVGGFVAPAQGAELYPIVANPAMPKEQAMAVCEPRAKLARNQASRPTAMPSNCPYGSPCAVQNSFDNLGAHFGARSVYKDTLNMCLAEAGWQAQ